ncbi:MAG TPA: tRNA adenosine deaminase-associated protein [Mycobacteriales bacterium]|nr:tRNA adenosine deaminase-associated protein [Mycobacteriales bacterium]
MAYFAAALARSDGAWVGSEFDLDDVEDLDQVVDMLRELAGDDSEGPALLFVEEDDEWFGVVRVDGDNDPRVFVSDSRVVEQSRVAGILYEEAAAQPVVEAEESEDDDDEESMRPAAEPAGDAELVADLGTSSARLLELCAEEGQLPADIITAICERAGCLDELDQLRGT